VASAYPSGKIEEVLEGSTAMLPPVPRRAAQRHQTSLDFHPKLFLVSLFLFYLIHRFLLTLKYILSIDIAKLHSSLLIYKFNLSLKQSCASCAYTRATNPTSAGN
jgi:hypothetical protein